MNDQKPCETSVLEIGALNHYSTFPIARLDGLASSLLIGARSHHDGADSAHCKADLIKIVKIAILDPVLRLHALNQLKPRVDKLWIFARGSLEVLYAI